MRFIITLVLVSLVGAPCLADMTGSGFTFISPLESDPGETEIFHFEVWNGSPDGEATRQVRFVFPGNFDVLAGWYDDMGQGWNLDFSIQGDWNEYAYFDDADGGVGEILPGQTGEFFVEVYIHENVDCGDVEFRAKQYGDEAGDMPHWMQQYFVIVLCSVPTEDSTWSTVKQLY